MDDAEHSISIQLGCRTQMTTHLYENVEGTNMYLHSACCDLVYTQKGQLRPKPISYWQIGGNGEREIYIIEKKIYCMKRRMVA